MTKPKQVKCPRMWGRIFKGELCNYAESSRSCFTTDEAVAGRFVPESEYRKLRKIEQKYYSLLVRNHLEDKLEKLSTKGYLSGDGKK